MVTATEFLFAIPHRPYSADNIFKTMLTRAFAEYSLSPSGHISTLRHILECGEKKQLTAKTPAEMPTDITEEMNHGSIHQSGDPVLQPRHNDLECRHRRTRGSSFRVEDSRDRQLRAGRENHIHRQRGQLRHDRIHGSHAYRQPRKLHGRDVDVCTARLCGRFSSLLYRRNGAGGAGDQRRSSPDCDRNQRSGGRQRGHSI